MGFVMILEDFVSEYEDFIKHRWSLKPWLFCPNNLYPI